MALAHTPPASSVARASSPPHHVRGIPAGHARAPADSCTRPLPHRLQTATVPHQPTARCLTVVPVYEDPLSVQKNVGLARDEARLPRVADSGCMLRSLPCW